ncbi:hypothetical protein jhhlp_002970 [Lomentospora prolificans]|uniref:Prokaryotic-type class I peptide chain release factors domain-containing protein n=1 Tax=Lomentospora prolificans TaxID=41688 RepID=A0A2N3NFI7_9PEZI|nr:hypothetical protein jhhlp_002970 [Lomentospora prolificans]
MAASTFRVAHQRLCCTALRISPEAKPRPSTALYVSRQAHYGAFDANLDENDLVEARQWRKSFDRNTLPRGNTVFARSSGPGGQHVNKTESKATTSWTIKELSASVPKLIQARLRSSRYYTARNDSLTFSAQTQRQRSSNVDENKNKLVQELLQIYTETVPGETDPQKVKKHSEIEKSFHNERIRRKKQLSSKKQFRRSSFSE